MIPVTTLKDRKVALFGLCGSGLEAVIANASASSLKVVTATTGPKISSWNTRILL